VKPRATTRITVVPVLPGAVVAAGMSILLPMGRSDVSASSRTLASRGMGTRAPSAAAAALSVVHRHHELVEDDGPGLVPETNANVEAE
jgi:hypothetical protein